LLGNMSRGDLIYQLEGLRLRREYDSAVIRIDKPFATI
jgi:hypothetical protein